MDSSIYVSFHLVAHKCVLMSLQTNLKADSTTKTLLQRCQDLVKIIEDYPAKVSWSVFQPCCLSQLCVCRCVCVREKGLQTAINVIFSRYI